MARQLLKDTHQGRYVTFCLDEWGHKRPHAPGRDYCRACWPPRGRGRGESLYSPRRLRAKERARQAFRLYGLVGSNQGPAWLVQPRRYTLEQIARALGYKDKSGAWRAIKRYIAEGERVRQMQEPILTPEESALAARVLDYLAEQAEAEAERLAERKRKKQEAAQRKRAKTLQAKRMAIAEGLAR